MKTPIRVLFLLISLIFTQHSVMAQISPDDVIFKAMNDELNRNILKLSIDSFKPPFFISYQMSDAKSLTVKSTLGSLVSSAEMPARIQSVRLMVGDYTLNDENFIPMMMSPGGGGSLPLPMENDYNAIRRSFWIATDMTYKRSIESYSQKLTAIKQQNKADEDKLDDFSKITPVSKIIKSEVVKYDKNKWEAFANDVSAVFKSYPEINNSSVYLAFANASAYVISNEGTRLKIPLTIACIWINANCQAGDGENLNNQLLYNALTPEQLPEIGKIKQDSKNMAEQLLALSKAPVMKESYTGPVIFEDEAVAELCSQKLFRSGAFTATREPIYTVNRANPGAMNKLDARINQKIFSENLTITETPKLKSFNNIPLIGSFEIDAEGVVPKDELILLDKGFLKTLLNDRIPTAKIKESNGHRRFALAGSYVSVMKAPGVVNISYNNESNESVRNNILKEAEKNGLEYVYLVRKFEVFNPGQIRTLSSMSGMGSSSIKPTGIYRISVKTGEEQLVRSAVISDFQLNKFKEIMGGSKEQFVYNTLLNFAVPASFIVPKTLVFSDISIEKDKSPRSKPPLVSNPLQRSAN